MSGRKGREEGAEEGVEGGGGGGARNRSEGKQSSRRWKGTRGSTTVGDRARTGGGLENGGERGFTNQPQLRGGGKARGRFGGREVWRFGGLEGGREGGREGPSTMSAVFFRFLRLV